MIGSDEFSKNVYPGASISIKPNLLRAECDRALITIDCKTYPTTQFKAYEVGLPLDPINPQIKFSMSSQIRTCDDLAIDPMGSIGSGGKPWKSIQWSVMGSGGDKSFELIQEHLNKNYNTSINDLVIVPKDKITPKVEYTISLRLTNYFDKSSILSKDFKMREEKESSVPQVM